MKISLFPLPSTADAPKHALQRGIRPSNEWIGAA